MTHPGARYDGLADWYEDYNRPAAEANHADLLRMLGPGAGLCLDLGCGTGQYFGTIRATGRTVVGVDRSVDQLRIARSRSGSLVQGEAAALPFADCAFTTVVLLWISTDVGDIAAVLGEVRRVLSRFGVVLFLGVHPCFNGPHVESRDDGGVTVHPTYRVASWHDAAPWWSGHGIRRRVGMRHVPLAELLNAFLRADLTIEEVAEPGDRPVPSALAVRAHRAGNTVERRTCPR